MSSSLMMYLIIAMIPICGILFILTPRLMPRDECFTVTIPEDKAADPRLLALRRRYTVATAALTLAATLIACWCAGALFDKSMSEEGFVVVYIVLFVALMLASFILMLSMRKKTQAIKAQEGWQAQTQQRAALIAEGPAPKPLSLAWNLLYIPVILFCAALALYLYPLMPDQIPMQVNLSGEVTNYAQKSIFSALFPVWVNLFMIACFVFSHWSINRQKMPVDPKKPSTSAYAYGAYIRAMTIMLLVDGILLCLCIGIAIPFTSVGWLTLMQGGLIVMVAGIVIVIGCIVLSLVYGQNGARLFKNAQASSGMARDDDAYWKAGVFYVNSKDPAVFVPKRFGVGSTVNFGNKTAWVVIIGFIVITGVFIVLISGI